MRHNNKTLISSLEVLDKIEAKYGKGAITAEDRDKLRVKIVNESLSLFETGALPREVENEEIISNQKLIQGIQQKRLPKPTEKQLPKARKVKKIKAKVKAQKPKTQLKEDTKKQDE